MRIGPFEFSLKRFKAPRVSSRELGQTGTTIFGGYLTGEDYVTELTGLNAITTYNKMRKSDGVVRAALLACELPIRAARWYVEPASEEKIDIEIAQFIEHSLFDGMTVTWDDFLREALLMLPFGYSVFEKVFQAVKFEGKEMIGWRKFAIRLQSTILKWKTESGNDGITQILPTGGDVSIPIEKLIIFTYRKEGDNWTGVSILRNAYRSWYFKEHIEKINAIAFERQGLGIPYGILPKGYTKKDRDEMEELLKNIRANEQSYMVIPNGWEVGFMDTKAKSVKDPDSSIRRYNREILGSVLAQFLDLGSSNVGSRALSADHSKIFHNNLTAIANQVQDTINKYAIKQLVDLNFTVDQYPQLKFSRIGVIQFEKIAKALTSLVQHGVIKPDDLLEDNIRILLGLPEKPEEEPETERNPKKEPKEKDLKPDEKKKASEFTGWRGLTLAESKVNFADIQKKMSSAEKSLGASLKSTLKVSGNSLIKQLQRVLLMTNVRDKAKALGGVAIINKADYKSDILKTTKEMFQYGKITASSEMRKSPPSTPGIISSLIGQANILSNVIANDLLKAGMLSLSLGVQQKQSNSAILKSIMVDVRRKESELGFNIPTISVGGSINQGRRAVFDFYKDDIYALQRSEILDLVTCSYCISIDKRIFRKNDPFTHNDQIHSHCRGIWVEILKEEKDKPAIEGIPKSLRERFETINVFRPPKNPIIKKNSPAFEFLKKKSDERLSEEDILTEKKIDELIILREKVDKALKDE